MPRRILIACSAATAAAFPALAAPPVSVELKTGDVVNQRVILSLDLSDALGDQRYFALGPSGTVVAGAVSKGDADDAPVTGFAVPNGGGGGSIIPRAIYEQTLLPGQSLVSFTPRNLGPDGAHHSVGYTLNDGETFARSTVFVGRIGQPTRRFVAADLMPQLKSDPTTLRLHIPRISGPTPSEGFLAHFATPSDSRSGFVAGDNNTTLVVNVHSPNDPDPAYVQDPAYLPEQGLLYGNYESGGWIEQLSLPFVGQPPSIILDEDTVLPRLFGGSIMLDRGPTRLDVSQSGVLIVSVEAEDTSGLLLGDFTDGFEYFPLADRSDRYDTFDLRAVAPEGSFTLTEQVVESPHLYQRSRMLRPAFGPAVLYETNAPIPGLPEDLRVIRTHWHKISDYGAVLMALRLAPADNPDAGFDAIVSRSPQGVFEMIAREGQPIPGDAEAMGVVTSIDTGVIGAPSEQILTDDGKGLFAARFDSGAEAILSVLLGAGPCSPADFAQPFTVFDASDILAFLTFFNQGSPIADLNADSDLDFDDVLAFLSAYANGCP